MVYFQPKLILWVILATVLPLEAQAAATQNDIVIVGAGISGLSAALEAARAGADVTVIDMGSVFGGHAVMSSGMVCLVDTVAERGVHNECAERVNHAVTHGAAAARRGAWGLDAH